MRAVADTGPLNYLVLIGQIALLPRLFEVVSIPDAVRLELMHAAAPPAVRRWISTPPAWLAVSDDPNLLDQKFSNLDVGERAAIMLALRQHADLILMDDRAAVAVARREGLAVAGTLGLLDLGAGRGLLDVGEAVRRLKATNFHCRQRLLDALLAKHGVNAASKE